MPRNNSEGDVESANKDDGPVMKKPKFKDDLKVYMAMIFITLAATGITLAKIKVVEAIEGTPDPLAVTFKPLKQRVMSGIMYNGDGFLPEDWAFFHSKENTDDLFCLTNKSYQVFLCLKRGKSA